MKKILVVMMMVLVLCGCGTTKNNDTKTEEKDYKVLMTENDYLIIDVRRKDEFDEQHIRDAINIPLDTIDENINLDKEKLIFVYCRSGKRSSEAASKLKTYGYNVHDLGGISSIDLDKVSTSEMVVKEIKDKTKEIKDYECAEVLDNFYTDSKYRYYFSCLKGDMVVVVYEDGSEEKVSRALMNGTIKIKDLDKYKIKYTKEKNNS